MWLSLLWCNGEWNVEAAIPVGVIARGMCGLLPLWCHSEGDLGFSQLQYLREWEMAAVSQRLEQWGWNQCGITERGTLVLQPLWCHTQGNVCVATAVL